MSETVLLWTLGIAFVVLASVFSFVFYWLKHTSGEVKQIVKDLHQLNIDIANQYVRSPALDETKEALRDFSNRMTHSIDGLQAEIKELSKALFMFMGSSGKS